MLYILKYILLKEEHYFNGEEAIHKMMETAQRSFHLPVLRIWCGHSSCYITHLQGYAPPVTIQGWCRRGRRAGKVRGGADVRAARTGGFRGRSFPVDLWHRRTPFDIRCGLTHIFDWKGKKHCLVNTKTVKTSLFTFTWPCNSLYSQYLKLYRSLILSCF